MRSNGSREMKQLIQPLKRTFQTAETIRIYLLLAEECHRKLLSLMV